jgi:signal transduction histidine kinase
MILLDKNLLRHCLANLLSNAIKYSGDHGLIELNSAVTETGCSINISDNGIGIPAADQAQLFDAFFRATNTAGIQGTGLGLNIVKRYANLMQGTVSFESREKYGTTFTLSFPAIRL